MSYSPSPVGAIVTDVEGTVTSIAFVKEVLFPYAREALEPFLGRRGDEPEIAALLAEARALANRPELDRGDTARLLLEWIEEDRKATPLKTLQGLIWEEGYATGAISSDIYPDAVAALERWHRDGIALFVYSSGSVRAQELIFAHSRQGDLTGLFSGYFDTGIGAKLESESYARIAAAIGREPGAVLFLSDHTGELDAARAAGFKTLCVDRGEAVIPPGHTHETVTSFEEIQL